MERVIPEPPASTLQGRPIDAISKSYLRRPNVIARIVGGCIPEFEGVDIETIISCIVFDEEMDTTCVMPERTNRTIRCGNTEDKTASEGEIHYDIIFDIKVPSTDELIRIIVNKRIAFAAFDVFLRINDKAFVCTDSITYDLMMNCIAMPSSERFAAIRRDLLPMITDQPDPVITF